MIFEPIMFILLFLAMLFTNMPRKEAIIYVMVTSAMAIYVMAHGLYVANSLVSIIPGLELGDPKWIEAWMVVFFQTLLSTLLVVRGAFMRGKDREFFNIMGVFLFALSGAIVMYRYDLIVEFSLYTAIYHTLAILQVLTVFYYSDGIKRITTSIFNLVHSYIRRSIIIN